MAKNGISVFDTGSAPYNRTSVILITAALQFAPNVTERKLWSIRARLSSKLQSRKAAK